MRFEVTVGLDLGRHPDSGALNTEESTFIAAPGRGPRRGRILIMDDDSRVRDIMRRQLVICGYEVVAAAEGQTAVIAYEQARAGGRPFDVVILDLMVSGGWGGDKTLDELLKLDPGVKALCCSGTLEGPSEDYLKKGFRGVLGKPYMLNELRGMVEATVPAP